ncbi:MAG TPA: hypothetical protein VNX27_11355 [Chthoniobacterales bacterium]|jgi:hypothetical protein|nr:hypothetical protein [Chthoniobacterales bacterium]
MQTTRRQTKKTAAKLRDLKPKGDPKGGGRVNVGDIHITKELDKGSAK